MDKNNKDLICPICGKPTRVYMGNPRKDRLCGHHADMLKNGLIEINGDGEFVDSKSKEKLVKESATPSNEKPLEINNDKQEMNARCIACGKPTEPSFFFCKECYHKYKNKKLLVQIDNCKDITILDDSYEGKYNCDDGHVVKSKSEMIIDNILFEKGIPHAYEKAFPIDDNEKHDLHPDFFLPNYKDKGDVYLEHWGFNENNIEYTKSKNYKLEKYKEAGITLICTNEKDMSDPKTSLNRKLEYFKQNIVNFNNNK